MAAAKTERLLNLVIALLSTRRPLPREAIRERVAPYREAGSDEAFERMFERDKEELRHLGIPLVTEDLDDFFEDEPGYRIDRSEYELPELDLTPEQLGLLALAGRTWSQASLGGAAVRALRKVESVADGEAEDDVPGSDLIETSVPTRETAFEAVRAAVVAGRPIRFDYRRPRGPVSTRHVHPWAIAAWHGHWYLTGDDVDRGEPRVFRLDRIVGEVTGEGTPGSYVIPDDHDPLAAIVAAGGGQQPFTARVRVRPGRGHGLRRRAQEVVPVGEWDALVLTAGDVASFADEIVGYGPDVVVDAPEVLRDAVVERLRAVLAAHGGTR